MSILIITEKPDAARRIAEALAEKNLKKCNENNVTYYEFERNGKKHVVACAVGHLFNLDAVDKKWTYPVFDVEWKPSHYARRDAIFSKKYFEVIGKLMEKSSEYIVATDYDVEGDVIAFNILRYLGKVENAKRMKFSTLTKDELIKAYENMLSEMHKGQVEAGLLRHYLDFLWGINTTRALTLALKNFTQKAFIILSTGRVQGPTLRILTEKELEIRKFKPKPFWQLRLHLKTNGTQISANYEKEKIWEKEEAEKIFEACKGDAIVEDVKKRQYKQDPPFPFNTTDLQAEAFNQFKFSPTQTMNIAESLYQAGYISYPRSASQKLPPTINYERILKALVALSPYKKFAEELLEKEKLVPHEGPREDPAHPAIYPTWEVPDLSKLSLQQRKIYDLIVRRTLAAFSDPAKRESNTIILDVNGKKFVAIGKRTIEAGWTKIYEPYIKIEEQILPDLKIGQTLKILKIEKLEKETQPPARYSQGSIIKELEKRNLGTKATRSEILQTLYERKYIKGKSIEVTKLGETVVEALKKYCPNILSEELTRKFEEEMELVYSGKKIKEEVIEEAKKTLEEILNGFRKNEENIGKELLKGFQEARREERKIGICKKCGNELRIVKSKTTKLSFIGCSGYPKCNTAYPIPRNAKIEATGKICEKCNTPIIQVRRKGKRTFRMCLDPKCETKKSWK